MPNHAEFESDKRPLERRSDFDAATVAKRKAPGTKTKLVAQAQFKQTLFKCLRRQARDGRAFSLACLEVLEHRQVKETYGAHAAEVLCRLARDVTLKNLRDADRLLDLGRGVFAVLMPGTGEAGAKRALTRIAQSVAAAKSSFHRVQLRASCVFRIVDSGQCAGDPETILAACDLAFAESGDIAKVGGQAQALHGTLLFNGSFREWFLRYVDIAYESDVATASFRQRLATARDSWNPSRLVRLSTVEPLDKEFAFDAESLHALNRRARVLQSIDHPGVMGLREYQLKDSCVLYLVGELPEGRTFADYVAANKVGPDQVVEWGMEICNSLIYLQSLMPPVVPLPLTGKSVHIYPDGRAVLCDLAIPYLFPNWHKPSQISSEDAEAAAQGRPVAAYLPVIRSLGRLLREALEVTADAPEKLVSLLDRLDADSMPKELNTIFKVRSALKEIEDLQRLKLAHY